MPGRFAFPLMLLLAFVLMALAHTAHSTPVMQATADDVAIVLHDETCKLDAVGGEKYFRAQWVTPKGAIEGCWGVVPLTPQIRVVVLYFSDKTMAAVPAQIFSRVITS